MNKNQKLTQKNRFPFCLSDEEMQNPMDVFYLFCGSSDLRTETHKLDRVLASISRSGYEYNLLCYDLVDKDYRRLIEAAFLLTDRKTLEEVSVERFLGLFAHEIKTQLSGASIAVEALIEIMSLFFPSQPNVSYYLDTLKSILFNSTQILSNMITTVQFKDGCFSLRPNNQTFGVVEFINECTMPYLLMNDGLNKNLVVEHNQLDAKSIVTDKAKLRQIIQNLLSNAYKYSTGEDIQLIVTGFAHYISFSVISFGHTIPPEDTTKLLKLYYKVNPGGAGAGVGLYLCQLYAEILDGDIKITSNNGVTSFTVSIPYDIIDYNAA
ncbi:sensor histidine kinase KdpD [Chitinophaga sp. S165]|uniref:sensor histidine kinase n=1 Tax=Chitinophaga sp. S165 TaxID=2135462 RepID=UPI000D71BA44|nr:HAMP domain-containing sensor histidine kinase [Chitinophaga sp. S165]PWV45946.1 signal transduction histidine kinase [Chitinophaga sp. S165]